MPHGRMKAQAEALGFSYSHKGCPCNGTPLVYTRRVDNYIYTLNIWEKRNVWRLTKRGALLATGNKDNLTNKIQEIWDFSKN